MDADSALAGVVLAVSVVLYGLYSIGEGSLLRGPENGGEARRPTLGPTLSLLQEGAARAITGAVLMAVAIASGAAVLAANASHWSVVSLGLMGLLLALVLLHGLCAGVGARWGRPLRHVLIPLWPVALVATTLALLQGYLKQTVTNGKARPVAITNGTPRGSLSDSDVEELLAPHEQRMISSILKLNETTTREIMATRTDIVAAENTSSLRVVAELMWGSGHSRVPVYEENIDTIVGVVHSRDLLRHMAEGHDDLLPADIARPPLFIPESQRLDLLLRNFQENHIQIAIVVDEYGGTSGLVTIEDLLEEIVGEIEDEFDVPDNLREMISEDEAIMDARIPLDEVNEAFDVGLVGDGFDTLGGLLYQRMGRIPSPGEQVEVEGLTIKVISTLGRRIKKVQVARKTAAESETG